MSEQALNRVEFVHGLNADRSVMIENIKTNAARKVKNFRIRRAAIVGGGPSAVDHTDHMRRDVFREFDVIAINGAHDWLLSQGIIPNYCVLMDANKVVDKFVRKPIKQCTYLMASQTYPPFVDRLLGAGADVQIFHAALDADAMRLMEELQPGCTITAPANTAGLHAISLAYLMGVRKLHIYGMDSSHRPDRDHAYNNSHQHHNDEIEFVFDGKSYVATGTWAAQADRFARMYPAFFRLGMRIEVFGDGLLPAMWAKAKQAEYARLKELMHEADNQPSV